MIDLLNPAPAWGYGPKPTGARARFAASASTGVALPLLDSQGIRSVVQTGTGLFTVTLADRLPDFTPSVRAIAAHAEYHDCPVFAIDLAAGTFQFAHYYANLRTNLAAVALATGAAQSVAFHILVDGRGGI